MLRKFLSLDYNKQFNISFLSCTIFIIVTILINGLYTLFLFHNDTYNTKSLTINDFEHNTIEIVDEHTIITASDDSYMIYGDEDKKIANITVKCEFVQVYGEFVCFYAKEENAFSANNFVHGIPVGDDTFIFELKDIDSSYIRLDFGVFPSVTVNIDEIVINNLSYTQIFKIDVMTILTIILFSTVFACFMNVLVYVYHKTLAIKKK